MVPLSHAWLQTLVGPRNILLKAQTCFWNHRILQEKMSTVQWHAASLYIVSLEAPNFWLEASLSNTLGSPQRHVLPQVSPYFWNHSEMVCPSAVLCSALQLPSFQLLTASASSLWPFDGYLGNPKSSKRLFKANSLHMINSSCRPQKNPPSWLTKVTESQKFIANNSNTLQVSSKKKKEVKANPILSGENRCSWRKARSWPDRNWITDGKAALC